MNKIYSLSLALCVATISFGQTYDLQLDLVTPTSGSTVPGTSSVSVDFTVINNGPDAIPAGDTLMFMYTNTGGADLFGINNMPLVATGFVLGTDLANGSTISGSMDLGGPFSFDLSAFPNDEICNVVCLGTGLASVFGSDPNETDLSNNFDSFIVSQTSGLNELNAELIIYPNPATNVLNVKSSEEVASMTILRLDGSIVSTSTFSNQVGISALVPGIYVYQVVTISGTVITNKFVKQ